MLFLLTNYSLVSTLTLEMIFLFPLLIIIMMVVSFIGLLSPSLMITWMKFNNQAKGIKSEITPITLTMARFGCIAVLIIGAFILFMFFTNFLPIKSFKIIEPNFHQSVKMR